jgi:cold shock CspA family protein/uncharacterized LabA/DUF88 family protein
MENKICRIAVFYDGTYFNKVSNYYLYQHERRARVSIKGLHDFILAEVAKAEGVDARHCQIVDASYFRGRLTAQQAQDQDKLMSDRLFEDVLMRADVTMFQQHVMTRGDGSFEEKRIDVWLALEAYEMASLKRYDVCVLLTGDGDFVPLVRKLNTLGSRVMLLGWDFSYERDGKVFRTYVSAALIEQANYPLMMDKVIDARERRADPMINNLFVPRLADAAPRAALRVQGPQADESAGVVFNLLPEKGFGFIKPSAGGDNIFFHASEVVDVGIHDLKLQDRVAFVLGQGDRGPVARKVRLDASVENENEGAAAV